MKKGIHPRYGGVSIACACGNVIETASVKGDFKTEICNMCHPFYTGKQKRVAAAGAVEKFNRRYKRK